MSREPVSLAAIELLCEIAGHEREIQRHLVALSEMQLDFQASGEGELTELVEHKLVRAVGSFAWQDRSNIIRLTPMGLRAAHLAADVLEERS